MKIVFLVSGSIRSNFSYRPLALARSLVKRGDDVSIIAPSADKYNNFVPETVENIDGVTILQPFQFNTKRLEINLLPYIFGAARLVCKEKPDLIYIFKPTPISIIGLIGKLFRKTTIVSDFDDLGAEVMRIEGHPVYMRKLVEWSEHVAAKYADRITVVSTYLHDLYHTQFPQKPILVIPNGIESNWLTHPVPSDVPKRIVFMGALNRKTILEPLFDVLPDVVHAHRDLKVLIIGDGKFLSYFKEKAFSSGVLDHVTFTGWLPLEEAKSRLLMGDIGYNYMPDEITIRAASNMKVPQYMSRGVVPLVSDFGDLPFTIDQGKAGYLAKPGDALALTAALINALKDQKRLEKAQHAIEFAQTKLQWAIFGERVHAWIHNESKGKKKVYVVSTSLPSNVGGAEIRNYNLVKQLVKQTNSEVHVFCVSADASEKAIKEFELGTQAVGHFVQSKPSSVLAVLKAIFIERMPPSLYSLKSTKLGDLFRAECEKSMPSIVHIEQVHAYYCIRPHITWLKSKGVRIVFDCHNVEFQNFKDSLVLFSPIKKMLGLYVTPHLKKMEIEASNNANDILVCSEVDAQFFRIYNKNIHFIKNGVDCAEFKNTGTHHDPTLIFMGSSSYPPNADAMQFYLKEIHPLVKKAIPEIRLLAIGTKKDWLTALHLEDSSIEPLGFVDAVQPYLSKASIGICPIRYGSGTRIKIMTYMAAQLAVVSTSKGAEGVEYKDGRDIIISNTPEEFAQGIIKLLREPAYRDKIAKGGYDFILEHYDWNVIGKKLAHIYDTKN